MNNERFIEMTEEEWFDTYKPIKNHIEVTSSFDGHMFETYGDEVEFVKFQDNDMIWMLGDGDDGGMYIWSGWGFVNRIGYFITEVPCHLIQPFRFKLGYRGIIVRTVIQS